MPLRDRCREFLDDLARDNMLRQGDQVAKLMAFVSAEVGRCGDDSLDDAAPIVMYLDDTDHAQVMAAFKEVYPNAVLIRAPGGRLIKP